MCAAQDATSLHQWLPTDTTSLAGPVISPSWRISRCDDLDHTFRYVGFRYEERQNFFEPRKVKELVFRCVKCGAVGTGLSDKEPVKEGYEFRANARHVFGWSDTDNRPKAITPSQLIDGGEETKK